MRFSDKPLLKPRTSSSRFRMVLDAIVTAMMLVVSGAVVWLLVQHPAMPRRDRARETTTIVDVPTVGDPAARIVIIAFSDFECEYCVRFARDVWPEVKARWVDTGNVQFAFRHLPVQLRPRALRSAQAAECADAQNRFWGMHDAMFSGYPALEDIDLRQYAKQAGLDLSIFDACMTGVRGVAIDVDSAVASSLDVDRTPTFLIGRLEADRRVTLAGTLYGALPISQFEKAITSLGGK
ncbi:DsbA family protein [Mycolicibacterium sp.]|uniref:DsbA family protein n=1 Tax=Mycolicibacterium sp. TaxID=2320850 RepID=UPI0037C9FE52